MRVLSGHNDQDHFTRGSPQCQNFSLSVFADSNTAKLPHSQQFHNRWDKVKHDSADHPHKPESLCQACSSVTSGGIGLTINRSRTSRCTDDSAPLATSISSVLCWPQRYNPNVFFSALSSLPGEASSVLQRGYQWHDGEILSPNPPYTQHRLWKCHIVNVL